MKISTTFNLENFSLVYIDSTQFLFFHSKVYQANYTAEALIMDSGVLSHYPELKTLWDENNLSIGVFSKTIDRHYVLTPGDRLEIYRPLIADPKLKREKKAKPSRKWHRAKTGRKFENEPEF